MSTQPTSAPASDSDEQIIRDLEDARFNAIVTGEFDAFAELSHPDLRYTHSNAVVDTLDSYLAKCRDGFYVYHSVDHPIDKITVIGDVALVFGEMKADLTAGGTHKQLDNGSLAVWTRTGPTWRLLAFQPTVKPVAPTATPGTGNSSG